MAQTHAALVCLQFKTVKPLGERVLIKKGSREKVSSSGILLPSTAEEDLQFEGTLVSVGDSQTLKVRFLSALFSAVVCQWTSATVECKARRSALVSIASPSMHLSMACRYQAHHSRSLLRCRRCASCSSTTAPRTAPCMRSRQHSTGPASNLPPHISTRLPRLRSCDLLSPSQACRRARK